MSDQEQTNNRPDIDPREREASERNREQFYRRYGVDFSANNVSFMINDENTDVQLGRDMVTFYLDGQISPHGGTQVTSYELGYVFQALSNRSLTNPWLRDHVTRIQGDTNFAFANLDQRPNLESALAKQAVHRYINGEVLGVNPEMTDEEMLEYGRLEKKMGAIRNNCRVCGDAGRSLETYVDLIEKQKMISLALVEPGLEVDEYEFLENQLNDTVDSLLQVNADIRFIDIMMRSNEAQAETVDWSGLLRGTVGANEVFSTCRQWLENQSDLDPISKLWVYMGRMTEVHPSSLEAMSREWPSFNESFVGISALCSGKYALGSNGEMYISGRYGMGYVNAPTGKLVDVDDAVTRDADGKKNGLRQRIIELGLNQIYVPGAPNGGVVDVVNGVANINGENVEIFSRNILYLEKKDSTGSILSDIRMDGTEIKLKDSDVMEFLTQIAKFVKGRDHNHTDQEIELSVELAREFYEFSMLANWNGVPRDSKNRPYYVLKNEPLTMSSDPESEAVKMGYLAMGTDESSLFPYWNGGDWGKLTLTRAKQLEELRKGRKHGLYTMIPFLPENLVKPLVSQDTIDDISRGYKIVNGHRVPFRIEDVFSGMNANEHFKTYWLDIYKACSVYDFISSCFIGDKDPTTADSDLIKLFMQPRLLEGLNKDIDLSLFWVDKTEAARLRVNIVVAALAAVAKEFQEEELMGVSPQGTMHGRLSEEIAGNGLFAKKINVKDLKNTDDEASYTKALRQLITSRFIGGEDEVMKVIKRIGDYKSGKSALGFSREEFIAEFGPDYMDRLSNSRLQRRDKITSRSKPKES